MRPIMNAIETIKKSNEKLRELAIAHTLKDKEPFGPLTLFLNGILDAAVMGGIANYEQV